MKPYLYAFISIAVALAAQWFSVFIMKSLALSFVLYSFVSCLALPLAWAVFRKKAGGPGVLAGLGLKPFGRREALAGACIGIFFGAVVLAAFLVAGEALLRGSDPERIVRLWGIRPGPLAFLYAAGLVLNGASEEIFWRGHLRSLLSETKPRWLAVAIPAVVFGGQHIFVMSALVENPAALALMMAGIVIAGLFWGILYERFKRLSMVLLSHAIVAVSYIGVLFVYVLG